MSEEKVTTKKKAPAYVSQIDPDTRKLKMPSGKTVTFRDTETLEYGERKDIMKKSAKAREKDDAYGTVENLLVLLIEDWEYIDRKTNEPISIPSLGGIILLDRVPNNDMNTLIKEANLLARIVFGVEESELEAELNPDSPLDKSEG